MNTSYKIYTEIIRRKLSKNLEEKKGLSETQLGFRKERGAIDAVYILKNAINESIRREKGKLYVGNKEKIVGSMELRKGVR